MGFILLRVYFLCVFTLPVFAVLMVRYVSAVASCLFVYLNLRARLCRRRFVSLHLILPVFHTSLFLDFVSFWTDADRTIVIGHVSENSSSTSLPLLCFISLSFLSAVLPPSAHLSFSSPPSLFHFPPSPPPPPSSRPFPPPSSPTCSSIPRLFSFSTFLPFFSPSLN